jgi:hypothetical protein
MRYLTVFFCFFSLQQSAIKSMNGKNLVSINNCCRPPLHSPVGIPGKSWVFRLFRQSLDNLVVHSQVQNGVHLKKKHRKQKQNENSKRRKSKAPPQRRENLAAAQIHSFIPQNHDDKKIVCIRQAHTQHNTTRHVPSRAC